jgi:hypothetical protein
MAFKMKSPLRNSEDKLTKIAFGSVPVHSDSPGYGGYQSQLKKKYMASTDSGVGTYPHATTGTKVYYDKKHQSYDRKKGLENLTGGFSDGKWVSNANSQKRNTPTAGKVNITKPTTVKTGPKKPQPGLDLKNQKSGNLQVQDFGGDPKNMSIMGTAKGDKALQKGKNQLVNKTLKGDNTKTSTKKPSNMPHDKYTGGVLGNNDKNKSTKSSSSSKTTSRKPIRSSDSGDLSGGYLKNTKNFSLGVDTKLNVASMPKFERTVTNARSADYDLVRAKGRGRTSRLKSRLDRRQGKVENRVDRSLDRIEARQQRQGTKYAGKMKAAQIKSDKGKTDPGYFDSQKKLDNVGIRGSESPKTKTSKTSTTTLASGGTFTNTPKKSTKRYMS